MAHPEKGRARTRKYHAAHPEKIAAYMATHKEQKRSATLRHNYGITVEQYDTMFKLGHGVCWICERPPKKYRLAVDHDHKPPKRVRGLACHQCNRYRIGRNTAETARKVLAYLESDFDGRNL